MSNEEEIANIGAACVAIEKLRASPAAMRYLFDRYYGKPAQSPRPGTSHERVLAALAAGPLNAADIAEAVGVSTVNGYIYVALGRLRRAGHVEKCGNKMWRLKAVPNE